MRDYANYNRRSPSPKRNLRWVMLIVLLALTFAFPAAMMLKKHSMLQEKKALSQNNAEKKAPVLAKTQNPSPDFEFYTLLPKMAVPTNKD